MDRSESSAGFPQVADERACLRREASLAVVLRLVQRRVRSLLQALQRVAGRALRDAHADGRRRPVGHDGLARVLDGADDGAEASLGLCEREAGREDGELVAAEARDQVIGSQRTRERLGDGDEDAVAYRVSIPVVDRLEVVHVSDGDDEPGAVWSQPFAARALEGAAVPDVGQRIDGGLAAGVVELRLEAGEARPEVLDRLLPLRPALDGDALERGDLAGELRLNLLEVADMGDLLEAFGRSGQG